MPQFPTTQAPSPPGPHLLGADVARAIVVALALFGIAFLLIRLFVSDGASPAERRNYWIAYLAAECLAFFGAVYLVFIMRRGLRFADLGYVAPEPRWALTGVMAGFVVLPLAFALYYILRPVLGTETNTGAIQDLLGIADFGIVQAGTLLLYGGFLVPIAEELLFRGVMFRWLRQRFAFWPAAFISSAVFGAFHVRPDAVIIGGLIGLPLALLVEKSRSLVPAILLHQTYNSLSLMFSFAAIWMREGGAA